MLIQHFKQIGKVEKVDKWMSHGADWKLKNHHFEVLSLFYTATTNRFLIGLWHVTKTGFYTTTGDDQLSGCIEKKLQRTSQSQTCTKKRSGSLLVCCTDPLQLSESQWNHHIWEACSANWWEALKTAMPAASIGQQNGSNSARPHPTACHTTTSKVEWIGLWSFVSLTIFTWPLTNTTFCRGNASTTNRRQKMLSKSLLNPKAWIFM